MKMKLSSMASMMLCLFLALSGTGTKADPPDTTRKWFVSEDRPLEWFPYTQIRQEATKIQENRIEEMALWGYFTNPDEDNPNHHIKDRKLIHLFVEALRNAEWCNDGNGMPGNISSEIVFQYRNLKKEEKSPSFGLNLWGRNQHYGRPFEQAILTLAEYRANELHAFLKKHADEVVSLKLKFVRSPKIKEEKTLTESSELSLVVEDLKKIGISDGFAYVGGEPRKLTFVLKNGDSAAFYLCVREKPKPAEDLKGEPKKVKEKPDPFFSSAFYTLTQPDPLEK